MERSVSAEASGAAGGGPDRASGSATVADLLPRAAALFGDRTAIRHRRAGAWEEISYAQLAERADAVGRGLIALGVGAGDRVCVLSGTRPEWTVCAFAIARAGAVVVPIYPTSSPQECAWVIGDSGAVAVVCEGEREVERIAAIAGTLPSLRHVVAIEPAAGTLALERLAARGDAVPAAELEDRTAAVGRDDRFAIAYTSGTTGPPKGCVHTHGGYRAGLDTIRARRTLRGEDDLVYLFLPLSHVFALMVQIAACDGGATVAYCSDPQRIVPELAEVRPTFLPSVPRIFEKVYGAVTAGLDRETIAAATDAGVRAERLRRAGEPLPAELHDAVARFEPLYERVRAVFGGRLREAGSGAAPIAPEILAFFFACGIPVMEGWGMTETGVAVTTSSPEHHRFGTVGRAVPGVEVRIDAPDGSPPGTIGEILVRGANIFAGYHGNPRATAEAFAEGGWLRTGDLGSLDADGYLTITGRRKEIIITAGGKNIAPANLENELKQSRWISHAVMHGDRRPYPVVLVTLAEDEIVPWARERGLPQDIPSLAAHPEVRALIQGELDRVNAGHARVAQAKRFAILDRDLSAEAGELTTTQKVKRAVVNERYAELFSSLYGP